MAPKKLSESDKQDILNRYRQSEETAASLATQYGVSTSTVSRLLKQSIPEREYEALVQQKRSGARTADDLPDLDAISAALAVVLKADRLPPDDEPDEAEPDEADSNEPDESPADSSEETAAEDRRRRRRSRAPLSESLPELPASAADEAAAETQLEILPIAKPKPAKPAFAAAELAEEVQLTDAAEVADAKSARQNPIADSLDDPDLEDDLDDDDDLDDLDDDLDDDEDDEDDDDDDLNGDEAIEILHIQGKGMVNVLPLSEAQIPRTCYVVVDRSAELITRPLKDFADLGQIPPEEVQAKTLPVFDNHRVAKRYLRRMQRIVKVPDGRMFQKVTPYLQAKGITRLLIDGQIYSI